MKQINTLHPACGQFEVQAITFAGSRDFVHLYLEAPDWEYTPGQFVMIRPQDWGNDPVWPRPFSICEQTEDSLRLFIQVIGRGTDLISRLRPGSLLDLWGPLGNGFRYDPREPLYILAGGMGIAPFMGLCKIHPHPEQVTLLFGHRVDIECYPFAELPGEIHKRHIKQETPADIKDFQKVLKKEIQSFAGRGRILACGPTPFLKVVMDYANEFSADCRLSLENKMACGIGACLGCAVKTSSGDFVQTCTHGPVFRSDRVEL
ncbi:MAG: dihydroorotate dehydrogenase electron transfer subunit [Desulfonatronovibrio sp.]